MALEDKDIFNAICNRYKDQPMDFIMEQYALARKINMEIEKQAAQYNEVAESRPVTETEPIQEDTPAPAPKRYTKRNLVIKPQEAITDDSIVCCICGLERQNLTSKHLAAHGLTIEEYKKLCGYGPDQKLMSRRRLAKSREIIGIAQQARMDKKIISDSFK